MPSARAHLVLLFMLTLPAASAEAADVSLFGGLRATLSEAAAKAGLKSGKVHQNAEKVVLDGRAEADLAAQEAFADAQDNLRRDARADAVKRLAQGLTTFQAERAARRAEHDKLALALQRALDGQREVVQQEADEVEALTKKLRALAGAATSKAALTAVAAESKKLVEAFNAAAATRKARREAKAALVKKVLKEIKLAGTPPKAAKLVRAVAPDPKAHATKLKAAVERAIQATRDRVMKKLREAIPAGKGLFKAVLARAKSNPVRVPKWLSR